ncbi:hypothetical protein [Carboxylicivirga caseinilyticus]|uniref:hypothetical protein n=1 Tax=Carboxylicivirga caseinilyticus TaxID=3417572 RepID=UPI003D3339D3|nr:hypothetical protein [Marinilabiliaceae bacterium A049]
MKKFNYLLLPALLLTFAINTIQGQAPSPDKINFVRQGVQRMIFDEHQSIPLAELNPEKIIGLQAMHPVDNYKTDHADVSINTNKLVIQSKSTSLTGIWIGGFNPFATYTIDLKSSVGDGEIGFQFTANDQKEQLIVTVEFKDSLLTNAKIRVIKDDNQIHQQSIAANLTDKDQLKGKIILQMLGSGFVLYQYNKGLPKVIGQCDFNKYIDLRQKKYIHSFQSRLFVELTNGTVQINKAAVAFTTGVGQADIRAITYENGEPLLDQDRLWYTMSIRGRALPHHIQGVFSMSPGAFDLKLEGIIVFDRNDGILRNEIASHIFYDRNEKIWRGTTTGFSAYANPEKEKKQLLAIESKHDPRFGFSVMKASTFGVVGDIEDPHIIYDSEVNKWRILTCINKDGYKAIIMESDFWNRDFKIIAGPVNHNSTGTSIQKIGNKRYCFSGSNEKKLFIYSYPDLKETGTLKMDLPPWDATSGSRVWPNVVQLPDGYPVKYVALMMDRFNYPGMQGPNWTYGALYLYHGYDE